MTNDQASASELLSLFHEALIALAPLFERAGLPWREPDAYDEWDSVAQALFEGFVSGALTPDGAVEGFNEIIPYDMRVGSYADWSFVSDSRQENLAFVCFETEVTPFDTCLFAVLKADGTVDDEIKQTFVETQFVFRLSRES